MNQLILKSKLKIFFILLLMTLIVPSIDAYTADNSLKDVNSHWAKDYIHQLIEKGAIDGYPDGTFKPNEQITRAAFVKVLVIALELDNEKDTIFKDTLNHWANGYIGAAIKAGIIITDEYEGLKFEPDKYITRIEMAQIITRALGKESDAINADIDKLEFMDKDKIDNNLKGYIVVMCEEGIITGYPDGRFGPEDHATRAQAAVMNIRMLDNLTQQEHEPITIAIFGTDERATETARSDIIMIVKYYPDKNNIILVSVPRDTRVKIPRAKTNRINAAYAIGGPNLLKETLENLFNTKIDYYVKMSFEDFKNIIDTFDGVKVNPEKDLSNWKEPDNILIKKGEQILNGQQALLYVRFRHDSDGDFGRIKRQQEVIKSLTNDIFQSKSILILPKLIKIFIEYTQSDISIPKLLAKSKRFKNIDLVTFDCYTLKTTSKVIDGRWFELIDEKDLVKLQKLLNNE